MKRKIRDGIIDCISWIIVPIVFISVVAINMIWFLLVVIAVVILYGLLVS